MTVTHKLDTATPAPVAAAPAHDNELYDADRAALYLFGDERKRQRLDKWRWAGIGPAYCKVGPRTVRYRKTDLDRFILANLRQPGSEGALSARAREQKQMSDPRSV